MPILYRDYETRSTLSLTDVGAWRYAGEASTDIWCASFAVDDGPVQTWLPGQPVPQEFQLAARDPAWSAVAHNDSFESAIEERLLGPRYGWPGIPLAQRRCSMAMALAAALPAKLETVAAALDLPIRKDTDGAKVMREMSRPRKARPGEDPTGTYWVDDPEKLRRLIAYNVRDVEVERELYRRLPPLSDAEQMLWQLDATINRRGFHVDVALAEAAHTIVRERRSAINRELVELTGGRITSIAQVARIGDFLKEHGHNVTGVGKRNVAAVLAHKPDDDVTRLLRLRQEGGKSSASKLDALLAMANDDRIHGTLKFHGAATGRWSGHGYQPHNLARSAPADPEATIAAVQSGTLARVTAIGPPLEVVGSLSRAMICAAPDKILIGADYSSIEPRVLCWLAGETWKLDAFRKFDATGDLAYENYCLVASRVLGRTVTPEDEEGRQIGKFMELAFGYGGALGAFRKIAPDANFTDAQVETFKQQWRAAHPRIVKFWGDLHRMLLRAVRTKQPTTLRNLGAEMRGGTLYLILPSGRKIAYPEARIEAGQYSDEIIFKDNALGKWREAGGWHGTFTENVVQAISRDLLAAAMQRIEAAGYPIVLHVHDEIVAEVAEAFGSPEDFARLMTTLPPWAEGLPVAAKASRRKRYAKEKNDTKAAPMGEDEPPIDEDEDLEVSSETKAPAATAALSEESVDTASSTLAAAIAAMTAAIPRGTITEHSAAPNDGHDQNRQYPHGERRSGRRIATYLYCDHLGGNHTKIEKKHAAGRAQYPQLFWVQGRWVSQKPKGWVKVPYRLPEMLEALTKDPSTDVFLPEGEKDADTIAALGLVATTNSEGATPLKVRIGRWAPELNKWFHGVRRLFILADNDEVGRAFAREKARALEAIIPDIRIVLFPDVPEGEDVSFWLNELGHSQAELLARCEAAERWQGSGYVLVRASDIVPRSMDWLWQGHILRGSQELLTGIPGGGKSQIHCAFVAYVTTGNAWPDGCNGAPPSNVIMLTAEDCLDQTIVPRLIATGADRDRVFVLKKIRKDNKERMFLLSEDLDELERMINKVGDVRLITIDPITAYMGGKLDSHRATDVRGQLGPLADLGERTDVALSAITHPPKHTSQRAIDHFIGSQAFIAAARIGHMTIEEMDEDERGNRLPTGRSLFTNPKNNVSRKMSTLAYRIVEKPLDSGIKAPCVIWEEIVDITADQAVAAATLTKSKDGSSAVIFLSDILANGPAPAKLIEERAAERGLSKDQLKRAKQKMGIVVFKEHGKVHGQWFWALPQHAPKTDAAS